MYFVYNILVYIASLVLRVIALFNPKMKLFVDGRKEVFKDLSEQLLNVDDTIWIHCASLGEFEQGKPVIEAIKVNFPNTTIVLTFFSPSGYEVKKNSTIADVITYLPLDTSFNAKQFLDIVQPKLAVFIKYEFWPNFLAQLKKREIHTILVSGIFRKEQSFFKWYGSWMRKSLSTFNHFFLQDEDSKILLNSISITNTSISGDTRFDRVQEILQDDNTLSYIDAFKDDSCCIVIGSSWPEDEAILLPFINSSTTNTKFIIAPHNIKASQIEKLKRQLEKPTILFSEMDSNTNFSSYSVFIVDTIGLLTKIYSYADIAYVGGGMGSTGLHNTLEPAVFGIPVVIGKTYSGFREAETLVALGGIISVTNKDELSETLTNFVNDIAYQKKIGTINHTYIQEQANATNTIISYLKQL